MITMILVTPYVAFVLGVAMMMRALHLYCETRPKTEEINGLMTGAYRDVAMAANHVKIMQFAEIATRMESHSYSYTASPILGVKKSGQLR